MAALFSVVATAIAYQPSFHGDFLYDDISEVRENDALASPWPPWIAMFDGGKMPHRPLPYWTFALNRALHGTDVWGFHAFNLFVHALNGLLVWWIARSIPGSAATRPLAAWAIASLWVVHPLTTQAVTYIYQRMEVMAALGILATLACFIKSVDDRQPLLWRTASVFSLLIGGMCKETAVAAAPLVVVYAACFLESDIGRLFKQRWRYFLALFAATIPCLLIVIAQGSRYGELSSAPWTLREYATTQPVVILHYIRLAIWPFGQVFDAYWKPVEGGGALAAASLLAAIAIGAAVSAPRRPVVAFLVLGFLVLLAPTSSLLAVSDICVEHRMYLPLAFVAAGVVLGVGSATRRALHPSAAGAVLVTLTIVGVLALAAVTRGRNQLYASRLDVWLDTATKAPLNPRAHAIVGDELLRRGDAANALAAFTRSVALEARGIAAHIGRAAALLALKQPADALQSLDHAIALAPDAAPVWGLVARAYIQLDQPEAAVQASRRGLALLTEINVGTAPLLSGLGVALAALGDPLAAATCDRAVEIAPDSFRVLLDRAACLATLGEIGEARRALDDARSVMPDLPQAVLEMNDVIARLSRQLPAEPAPTVDQHPGNPAPQSPPPSVSPE